MILTKEQLEKRLNSPDNVVNRLKEGKTVVIVKDGLNHQGNMGAKNLTQEQRVQIGVLANLEGNEVTADLFGISKRHTTDLKRGSRNFREGGGTTDTKSHVDVDLKEKIQERLDKTKLSLSEMAAERLMRTLGVISDEKLENCSVKDAAGIANQMSQVMRNMNGGGRSEGSKGSNVRIILNQPKEIKESSFDIIEVQAG